MRKKIMALILFSIILLMNGCVDWNIHFQFPTTTAQATISTLPTLIDGTLTVLDEDYATFSSYHSETYDLTDIDEYNDILFSTRDKIKRANVQVITTISRVYPFSTIIDSSLSGSGVIFKADATHYYVLTNQHVIDDNGKTATYEIFTFGSEIPSEGTLVASDEDLDLAVLKFAKGTITDVVITDITSRVFRKFNEGELVLAVGNPLSVVNNVTFGEFLSLQTINNATFKVIYHNATIHEGSSGGALVDIDGLFLGINTWGSNDSEDQAFAIPNYIVYMFLINNGLI